MTALVDGRLSAAETEEALVHAVGCPSCAETLRRERASRRALAQSADVVPDDDLTARLLDIQRPGGHPVSSRGARRPVLVGLGAAATLGVVVAGLSVVGAMSELRSDPHDILAAVQGRSGTVPAGLPAGLGDEAHDAEVIDWLEERGWSVPAELPGGVRVVAVEVFDTDDGEILEVEMSNGHSHVRVLQQHGQLAGTGEHEADGGAVVAADDAGPWRLGATDQHVVVQSGECVVVLTPAVSGDPHGDAILEAMPGADYDTSVVGRFGRGWQAVASWATD